MSFFFLMQNPGDWKHVRTEAADAAGGFWRTGRWTHDGEGDDHHQPSSQKQREDGQRQVVFGQVDRKHYRRPLTLPWLLAVNVLSSVGAGVSRARGALELRDEHSRGVKNNRARSQLTTESSAGTVWGAVALDPDSRSADGSTQPGTRGRRRGERGWRPPCNAAGWWGNPSAWWCEPLEGAHGGLAHKHTGSNAKNQNRELDSAFSLVSLMRSKQKEKRIKGRQVTNVAKKKRRK